MSNRLNRINEEIQRELSKQLRALKDPRIHGVVSITAVETTQDLRYAKVFVSILNKEDEAGVMKGLKSASGWLRRELGASLTLRYTPELIFCADDSIGYGAKINKILGELNITEGENGDK